MKCSICGSEIPAGSDICTNCGTRVNEMGANPSSGNNGINSNNNINNNFNNTSFTPVRTKKNNVAGLIAVVFLVVLLGIGFFLYSNVLTKTINEDGFTAKIPMTMKETDDSESLELTEDNASGKVYRNSKFEFGYIVMDLSAFGEVVSDSITEEFYLELMDSQLKTDKTFKNYEKISFKDNMLECYLTKNNGVQLYNKIFCKKSGDKIAVFIVDCKKGNKTKTESKMQKILDSIVMK